MSSVCVLCLAECPAAGGVCSGCEVELRAWLQWRATHFSPPHTAHRTLRVLLTRLPPPRGPQSHQPHNSTQGVPPSSQEQRHPQSQTHPKQNPTPCPKCGTRFSKRSGLLLHLRLAHQIPSKDCKKFLPKIRCEACNMEIYNDSLLTLHDSTRHKKIHCPPFPCDMCPRRFARLGGLRFHRTTHFEPKFCCVLCDKKFYRKANLQDHIVNIHSTRVNKHVCALCGKALKSAHYLKVHKRDVHGNRKVKCSICGLLLKSKSCLRTHRRYVHGPRDQIFHCSLCEYTAHVKLYLNNHIRYTHSSNNIDAYQCDTCNKCYKSKGSLKIHVQIHFNVKHPCSECGKSFKTLHHLKSHHKFVHVRGPRR